MSTRVSDVMHEVHLGIRAHYASGHFDLDEALIRIRNGGFGNPLTDERAREILSQPITVEAVKTSTGRDVTDAQIAARLADVDRLTADGTAYPFAQDLDRVWHRRPADDEWTNFEIRSHSADQPHGEAPAKSSIRSPEPFSMRAPPTR